MTRTLVDWLTADPVGMTDPLLRSALRNGWEDEVGVLAPRWLVIPETAASMAGALPILRELFRRDRPELVPLLPSSWVASPRERSGVLAAVLAGEAPQSLAAIKARMLALNVSIGFDDVGRLLSDGHGLLAELHPAGWGVLLEGFPSGDQKPRAPEFDIFGRFLLDNLPVVIGCNDPLAGWLVNHHVSADLLVGPGSRSAHQVMLAAISGSWFTDLNWLEAALLGECQETVGGMIARCETDGLTWSAHVNPAIFEKTPSARSFFESLCLRGNDRPAPPSSPRGGV